LSDLLLFELDEEPGVPLDDVREVSRYIDALEHGMDLLEDGLPLSLRLIREVHGVLMQKGRGTHLMPGAFRRSQNWIGGTRPGNAAFVPPPVDRLTECMGQLELFLHDQPESTSVLLKAALAHVQFETIHPFLDGNGRIGRMLIPLLLCEQKVLRQPILYLSLYFKTHRRRYYELLNEVRITGDWEQWLDFFANAVLATAHQAIESAVQLKELTHRHDEELERKGRSGLSAQRVLGVLREQPIATSGWLVEKTGLTAATVNKALRLLGELQIVHERTHRKRNRIFRYTSFIEILNRGTELP